MDNSMIPADKAEYDNRRFPKKWQAMLGCAIMQITVYAGLIAIMIMFGGDYRGYMASSFGSDMFSGVLSQFLGVLIIPLVIMAIGKKDFFATVRLKKNLNALQILLLVLTSAGLFFFAQYINGLVVLKLDGIFGTHSEISDIEDAGNIIQLVFEFFVVALLPSFCEEIFFRGMVLRSFERSSTVGAVIISSICFSIMHGNATQFTYALFVGLILGTVTIISDSLWAGAIIHFTLNMLSALISYQPIFDKYSVFVENNILSYYILSLIFLPCIALLALAAFILYTRARNTKKYGKPFVSEMEFPELMKKESKTEKIVCIACWIFFILSNTLSAIIAWKGTI